MASITTEEESKLLIVLPGDQLPEYGLMEDSSAAHRLTLGPGLAPMDDDSITAVKAGILKHNAVGNRWWVESNQRRVCSCLLGAIGYRLFLKSAST